MRLKRWIGNLFGIGIKCAHCQGIGKKGRFTCGTCNGLGRVPKTDSPTTPEDLARWDLAKRLAKGTRDISLADIADLNSKGVLGGLIKKEE
jgi:hypothetical protein